MRGGLSTMAKPGFTLVKSHFQDGKLPLPDPKPYTLTPGLAVVKSPVRFIQWLPRSSSRVHICIQRSHDMEHIVLLSTLHTLGSTLHVGVGTPCYSGFFFFSGCPDQDIDWPFLFIDLMIGTISNYSPLWM
jgi:hypothetical protein